MSAADKQCQRAKQIEASVRQWIDDMVVELGLCPFARHPVEAGKVRVVVSSAKDPETLLHELHRELSLLDRQSEQVLETTLIAIDGLLEDFHDYNDFLDLCDALLEQFDWLGTYQLASFHPQYQFAGTQPDDAENYSNRSPWPLLHLLRESSVERAIAAYPDTDDIPRRNTELMQTMGTEALKHRLAACTAQPPTKD